MATQVNAGFKVAAWADGFFDPPARFRVAYGGRSGGKDYAFCQALAERCLTRKNYAAIVAREYQSSISASVKSLFEQVITDAGLEPLFEFQGYRTLCPSTGATVDYRGLETNRRNIKGWDVDLVWVNEGEAVSRDSWQLLVPTVRRRGSEIWVCFNPRDPEDPVSQEFIVNPRSDAVIKRVNWWDNPFLPEVMTAERLDCLERTPHRYPHIWEGDYQLSGLENVFPDAILRKALVGGPVDGDPRYGGVDLAYTEETGSGAGDYTAVVCLDNSGRVVLADRVRMADTRDKVEWIRRRVQECRGVQMDSTMETETARVLRDAGYHRVDDFKYTKRSKAELVENCIDLMTGGKVTIPESAADLLDEMRHFVRDEKDVLAGRAGRHDDLVNAFMLACWSWGHSLPKLQAVISGGDDYYSAAERDDLWFNR